MESQSSDQVPVIENQSQQKKSIAKLAAALSKAQGEIKAPVKNRHVDFQPLDANRQPKGQRVKYSYADLADCIEAIREPLAKNDLAIVHKMVQNEKFYDLQTILMHSSGESISTIYPLPDPTSQKPQEFGSALTYARRYSLSSLLGIASEEDDDGVNANPPPTKQIQPPAGKSSQPSKTSPQANPKKDPHPPLDSEFTEGLNYLTLIVNKRKLPPEFVKETIKKVTGKVQLASTLTLAQLNQVVDEIQKS